MINILGTIIQSIRENWSEIVVGITLIVVLLLTLSLYGLNFEDIDDIISNNKGEKKQTIEIVYEGMVNKFDDLCTDSEDLEKLCSGLGSGDGKRRGCNVAKCCVWAKNNDTEECIEGDKSGPMFQQDKNGINYDEYYYLNKQVKINQV